ncbi:MAG TPA: beta-ketoacyl synthase N-terminal-like domain-containing protein [Thermoanaerobaculia bacterium]|nr:beta-ketoacyl synthase N-terminal-like domain-containing protein [Thermoanaerobaculia bacterium]
MSETNGIAIVGMAGRFPGAADLERFWENLAAGIESVTVFRREELEAAGVDPALLADPAYVPARAVVDGAELFDAGLFGYNSSEAEVMDPQHRLLLECAWEALEHAGTNPWRYGGLIGVYAGTGPNTYLLFNLAANREILAAVGHFQVILGNGPDYLTSRLSYKLGLRGPSLTVQTACSTSLVAVHLAVQSLLNGECDLALAGGVRLTVPRPAGYLHQTDGVLSPDGHCRPFDAAAGGTVDGEGAGIVVLKRLADALDDGDHVHAVILGTAVNNDGAVRVGYTAPGLEGQAAVVAMAQAVSAIHPETIGLVEGHGTATPLGDPIEVSALRQVFEAATSRKRFCALGSVKGNIGHLETAAGVASLIKAALALERGVIPPTPHFQRPNPRLELEDSPFFVNATPLPWPPGPEPRRAGVSSFGLGGTNAHAILEEAPPIPPGDPAQPWQLLVLSAASAAALEAATDRLANHLAHHPGLDLADAAFTLQMGRQELAHRRMLVCQSLEEAREALDTRDPRKVLSGFVDSELEGGARADLPGQGAGPEDLEALGRLWLSGAEVDWQALHAGERRLRVALPTYPFQRQRYWISPQAETRQAKEKPGEAVARQPRPMGTPYVPPRTDLERRVAGLFEDLLGFAPVGASDRFFDMGGHSLLGLQLLSRVKSDLGAEVRLEWLFQASSVSELAELIGVVEEENQATSGDTIPRISRGGDLPLSFAQERLSFLDRLDPGTPTFNLTESVRLTGVNSCLVRLQSDGEAPPFFCIHPAGGNVFCYRDLATHLGPEQPFYGIQAQGREEGEEPLANVAEMAARYLEAVAQAQPQGPYLLGGWSFGGIVAYEMARQLVVAGEDVGMVALFDCGTHTVPQTRDDAEILADLLGIEAGVTADELRRLGGLDEQLDRTLSESRRRGISIDLDLPRARRLYAVYKASSEAHQSYQPSPYPGRVTLFRAIDRPVAAVLPDPTLGWGALAQGGVDIVEILGRHETLVIEPSVGMVAERLRERLRSVRSRETPEIR